MASGSAFTVLKDLPSDPEPSDTTSYDSEEDEWETEEDEDWEVEGLESTQGDEQAPGQNQQQSSNGAPAEGHASKLKSGFFGSSQPTNRAAPAPQQVKSLRSTYNSTTSSPAGQSSSSTAGQPKSSTGLKPGFFGGNSSTSGTSKPSSAPTAASNGNSTSSSSSGTGFKQGVLNADSKPRPTSSTAGLKHGFFNKPPPAGPPAAVPPAPKQQSQQQQRPAPQLRQQMQQPFVFGSTSTTAPQQQQQPPPQPEPQQSQRQQPGKQQQHLRRPQPQQQHQQQPRPPPQPRAQQQSSEHQLFLAVYELCVDECLRCTRTGPDSKYVRVCSQLHAMMAKYPKLEQLLHGPKFKSWLLQNTDFTGWQGSAAKEFASWMTNLLWNVAISGSVSDLQRVLKLTKTPSLQQKAEWFTLMLGYDSRGTAIAKKEALPHQLVAQPGKLYIWEELVKYNRWEVLLEGLKDWPDAFGGLTPYHIDTSDGILLLQQLLYAKAPLDVIQKALDTVKQRNQRLQFSIHLWFFPPGLMPGDARGSRGLKRADLRKCRLPDVLTLAVQQGRHELVGLLLEYTQWPIAAVPEGKSYLTDGTEVVVDIASLSQPDRRGWWFDSAAVWTAVKRADETSFNKLWGSINRSAKFTDDDNDLPDLESDDSDYSDDEAYQSYRSSNRTSQSNRNWQPAINYHIDALIEGTTPLLLAVRAGNVKFVKALIQGGADLLTVCVAAAGSSSKKADSSSSSWTTPLHLAVEMNQVKLLQDISPGLNGRTEILRPKAFSTPRMPIQNPNDDVRAHTVRDVTIWNSAGETPLTLAVRLGFYNAAIALLSAGFNPCQVVSVYIPGNERDEHTHALMLAVKAEAAAAADGSSTGSSGTPSAFLQHILKQTPESPWGLINWPLQLDNILDPHIAGSDRQLMTDWLSTQPTVVSGLSKDVARLRQLIWKYALQPAALLVLLDISLGSKQSKTAAGPEAESQSDGQTLWPTDDAAFMQSLLIHVLGRRAMYGSSLTVLLCKVHYEAGALANAAVAVHGSNAPVVGKHIGELLECGLSPNCKDAEGVVPLSHMILPYGLEHLQPLLDTNDQRVVADIDTKSKQNLLHAAAAIADINQRSAAVAAVAGKAAQQGWHAVFTAKNSKQQTAAVVVKNGRLKQLLAEAEARARQVAAANRQKAAKAAAAAAKTEEQQQQHQQQQQDGTQSKQDGSDGSKQEETATAAAAKDGSKDRQAAAAAADQQQKAAAAAVAEAPVAETEQQRSERLDRLLAMIPNALQAALAPAVMPAAAAAAEEQQRRLTSSQRAAADVELVRSRIASLAPDQLPQKDVALSDGLLPAAAADRKRKRRAAAAAGADQTLDDSDLSDLSDSDHEDEDLGSGVVANVQDEVDQAEGEEFDENSLNGLPWEFTMTREARLEWTNLEPRLKRLVGVRLRHLGLGYWHRDGVSKKLNISEPGLDLWRTKITRGARIVWQITVDYSKSRGWIDMLRVWSIHATHAHYDRTLSGRTGTLHAIIASHRRSQKVRRKLHLKALPFTRADNATGLRLPGSYEALPSAEDDDDLAAVALAGVGGGRDGTAEELARIRAAAAAPGQQQQDAGRAGGDQGGGDGQLVEHLPPANGAEDVYTLLKMYTVSSELVRAVLRGQGEEEVDFPFRVSKAEMNIIEMVPRPPSSILLLGRSGTGKTTVLVFRLFSAWLARYQHSHEHLQAVFVTASATLKEQVSRTFRKLQAAAMTDANDAAAVTAATANDPTTLVNLAPAAFPLFTTTRQWLMLLDASVSEPFFVRGPDGRLAGGGGAADDSEIQDWDGIGLEVDLQGWTDDEDEYEDEDEDNDDNDDDRDREEQADAAEAADAATPDGEEQIGCAAAGSANGQQQRVGRRKKRHGGADAEGQEEQQQQQGVGKHWPSREVTYADFVSVGMWSAMTKGLTKDEKARLKAPLVYQEVMSYIKGSAEALEAGGHLSLDQYQDLGRKRAPNFTKELRQLVYRCYEAYEAAKSVRQHGRGPGWDRADLAAHLYRQLLAGHYRGARLDGMFRDEVQDFLMAELLLDLKVCHDPNSMFYCGDTCQTIARGVGFRFEEVRTMLYKENERRKGEGVPVGMPQLEVLKVNYRTHAGILDAASSITALLRACFPLLLDKLPRESAFFSGPRPLLLDGLSTEELSILLSSGDPTASQVEFGAHQVVLVRDLEARERLPAELKASNALIMTVGQSKGLEFDDCFLVDFCADSPASQEWRVLLQLLEQYEETVTEVAKYLAAKSGRSQFWQKLADRMTAQDLRLALKDAAASGDPAAGAALAAANRDGLLLALPGAAQLTDAGDTAAAAVEAGGWLRPLKFDSATHSLLCEELKQLYVAITRAKNNLVIFDRDSQKRAPLYRFFRRLGLATHVASVTGGLVEPGQGQATGQTAEVGIMRGSMSNTPSEWAKRARNLVEMKLFKLAAQCYGCAGDVLRAAAYGAMQQIYDLHTNAQESSGATVSNASSTAAPAGRSKALASRSAAADNLASKAKRREVYLAAADVLLTCAVQGGTLAKPKTGEAAGAAVVAVVAAAQRAGVSVPTQDVEEAVKPPLTPKEQMAWLRLAANAFRSAGKVVEAGKLLLGFGPDIEDGKYWQFAKRLLRSISNENAAVAAVFEDAARQELGLGRSNRRSSSSDAADTAAEPVGIPEGVHGSFLSASRLLREALSLYQQAGMWGECWRLLNEYEGLRPLLRQKAVDEITLAWISYSARKPGVHREDILKAINTLRDPVVREGALREQGFWRELAAIARDPAEAARLLAQHGDYEAAADRCLADANFLNRATAGQLRQVHGWLLRAGTAAAARKAVALWETLQQQGRLSDDIAEGLALAQLTLARLLLREVVGAQLPAIKLERPSGQNTGSKKLTEAEKEAQKRAEKRERRKADKERLKAAKLQQKDGQTAQQSAAVEIAELETAPKQDTADTAPAGAAAAAPAKSYAAAASAADSTADSKPASNTSTTTAPKTATAAASTPKSAPIPTACLATLQDQVQAQPDYQDSVQEALRALADAQQTFLNCHQPAGAAEALSWALAAKSAADITTAQWQKRASGEEGMSDTEKVLTQAKAATELLQALATITSASPGARPHSGSRGGGQLSSERVMVCLSALERFYGVKQLADHKQSMQPLEFRDESVVFTEALFALDNNPGKDLIPPAATTGHTRVPLIPYKVAVRAIAAHIYKHMAASLAHCIRAAHNQLQQKQWLQMQLTSAAAAGEQGGSSGGGSKGPAGRTQGKSSSGGGSGKGPGKAVTLQGLDLDASHVVLQRSAEVLVLALSAHTTLRDAASVLRSSHQLADLAINEAYWGAEGWATQLSSLAVALEFPALDLGIDHDRATAGAMPVMQACLKKLPIQPKGGVNTWFDNCRQLALQKVAQPISQLTPYDAAAALWMLRASCYKYTTAAGAADPNRTRHEITEHARKLRDTWYRTASKLINDSEAYQALLEDGHYLSRAQFMLDAELLIRAREAWLIDQPAEGCSQLMLLLERGLVKEQLAAGQLQQQQADVGAGSGGGAADRPAAAATGSSTGKPGSSKASWSKVRPLPPDLYVQLLENVTAAASIGLAIYSGTSGINPNSGYCYIPSSARNQLLDPVLVPAASLVTVTRSWQNAAVSRGRSGPSRGSSSSNATQQKANAELLLQRCLRVCYHLAKQNWRRVLDQQQQQAPEQATAPLAAAQPDSQAAAAAAAAAAAEAEPADQPSMQKQLASDHRDLPAETPQATPLIFAEQLAALAANDFDIKVLYPAQQQQQQSQRQRTSDSSSSSSTLGDLTVACLPVLAARCSLLLGCLIMTLGAWDTSAAAGGSSNGAGQQGSTLQNLLLPAVAAAHEMVQLAVDLSVALQARGISLSSSKPQQQQQQHWLVEALQPLQKLLAQLQPAPGTSAAAAAPPVTRSRSRAGAAAVGNERRVSLVKWSEALLSLAQPLGVQLLQVAALVGNDKVFHGVSSKPAAQLPKQEKALVQAAINLGPLPPPPPPPPPGVPAAAAAATPAQLQLPSLTELHLGKRLSPAERQALEKKAEQEELLRKQLQEGRLRFLRACPDVRQAIRNWRAEIAQRLAERAAQEQAARAAEAAAAAGGAAGAAGAGGISGFEEIWLPSEVYWVWGTDEPNGSFVRMYYQSTFVGYSGSGVLVSLHKVLQDLKELEGIGTLTELMCPICAAASSTVQQQQQQGTAAAAAGGDQGPAAGSDSGGAVATAAAAAGAAEGDPADPAAAAANDLSGGGLSAAASTFVPHVYDGYRHSHSLAAYQAYVHFVSTQVTPWLWLAAQLEYQVKQYQRFAHTSNELFMLMQRPNIRLAALEESAHRLFESMNEVRECRDWVNAPPQVGVHLANFTVNYNETNAEFATFQQEIQHMWHQQQQQQQQYGAQQQQQGVYTHQQLEAQMLSSAATAAPQQHQQGGAVPQGVYQQQQQWYGAPGGASTAAAAAAPSDPWAVLQGAGATATAGAAAQTPAAAAAASPAAAPPGEIVFGDLGDLPTADLTDIAAATPAAAAMSAESVSAAAHAQQEASAGLAAAAGDSSAVDSNTAAAAAAVPTAMPQAPGGWGSSSSFAAVVTKQTLPQQQQQQQYSDSVRPPVPPPANSLPSPARLPLYRPPGMPAPAPMYTPPRAAAAAGPDSDLSRSSSATAFTQPGQLSPAASVPNLDLIPSPGPGPAEGPAAAAAGSGPGGLAEDLIASRDDMLSFVQMLATQGVGGGPGGGGPDADGDQGDADDGLGLLDDDFTVVESKKKKKRSAGQGKAGRGGAAAAGRAGGGQQQQGKGGGAPARSGGAQPRGARGTGRRY